MQIETVVQLRGARNGGKSAERTNLLGALAMSGYYPDDDGEGIELKAATVRVAKSLYRDLEFIADLWNAFDAARGVKRPSQWKPSSVMERLLTVGRDGVAEQIGGIPNDDASRAKLMKEMAAKVAALSKSKK